MSHDKGEKGKILVATMSCPKAYKKVDRIAYNLTRTLMAQAAVQAGCLPIELSFKHSIQLWLA